MNCTSTRLPYRQTNAFSRIAMDYIDQVPALKPFFQLPVSIKGIQDAMAARKQFATNRELLVQELNKQYNGVTTSEKVQGNINSLLSPDTFTITTAHQNNIFTGPLYFIYKILHAIRLAEECNQSMPGSHFVPVYYMGSEDADLDELNHIYLEGEKKVWNTNQTGAVGRMKVDKELLKLISAMEGQLNVHPHGNEITGLFRQYYKEGTAIQDATFQLVNHLFAAYGLIVLIPDNAALKSQLIPVFKEDLLHQASTSIVEKTASQLDAAGYKVQANPREINLFYLIDNKRERIEKKDNRYIVLNTDYSFDETSLLNELAAHPERFSPNVILRGLYQETILPNIAFIGGGGETAYWLQLKSLFEQHKVPFPMLVLRNSFLVVEEKWRQKISQLGFEVEDFFAKEETLVNKLVAKQSKHQTRLNGSLTALEELYESFKKQAADIDSTLEKHVEALKAKTVYRLHELEKKMLRAEKRKYAEQRRKIQSIRQHLFPGDGLQERVDNLSHYYAKWGKEFIQQLLDHSLALEQEFVVMQVNE